MTVDCVREPSGAVAPRRALRPDALGLRYAVAAGHPLAALAAFRILEAGGNAVDAGVAGGNCLGGVPPDIVSVAGGAPNIIYDAAPPEALTPVRLRPRPRRPARGFLPGRGGGPIPRR